MAKASEANTTRRAILSAGLAAASLPLAATGAPQPLSSGDIRLAPTELGYELLRRMPAYAEAIWKDCRSCDITGHPDYDADKVKTTDAHLEATNARVCEAIAAILDRAAAVPSDHLVDLAIATRAYGSENEDFSTLGGRTMPEECACALEALVGGLLAMGNVPNCSLNTFYEAVDHAKAGGG